MVHIPIHNKDPLNVMLLLSVAGGQGYVVEHAIPVHKTVLGVVSRRPG